MRIGFFLMQDGNKNLNLATKELSFIPPIGSVLVGLRKNDRDFVVTHVHIDFDKEVTVVYVK